MDKCVTCKLRYNCSGIHQFRCEMGDYKSYVEDEEILKKIGEHMLGEKFREKEKEYQDKIAQLEKVIKEQEKQAKGFSSAMDDILNTYIIDVAKECALVSTAYVEQLMRLADTHGFDRNKIIDLAVEGIQKGTKAFDMNTYNLATHTFEKKGK